MKHFPLSVHSFKMKLLISLLTIGLLPLVSISVFDQHFLDAGSYTHLDVYKRQPHAPFL